MMPGWRITVAVTAGGGLGSAARWLVSLGTEAALGHGVPWGTLAVNVAGSFLIGLAAALTGPGARHAASPAVRAFLMAGFCGGFTTFSVFSLESLRMLEAQGTGPFAAHVALSVALWLSAASAGYRIGSGGLR